VRVRTVCIAVVFAGVAGSGCAASPGATSSAPSTRILVSGSVLASAAPASDAKEFDSPAGQSSPPAAPQPQVYVTDAQLLSANDGAMVVKDCPAQGSCAFRIDVTSDGGATWRRGRDLVVASSADEGSPSEEDPITGVTMVSATEVYAYGASVWHTSDAGATWAHMSGTPPVDDMASSDGDVWAMVACADLSDCASSIDVVSSGRLTPLPRQPGGPVGSIVRQGRDAYAVLRDAGGVGELAVSHDNGTTWQHRALPQQYCTYSLGPAMTITTTGDVYLICANGASAGTEQKDLFVSTNGAVSWQHVAALEVGGYADTIIAASPHTLWRDGGRAPIFNSTDDGKSWRSELDDKVGDAAGPETQAFAAANTNALVFAFALPPGPTFTGPWTIDEYRTTDAGANWQIIPVQP
jgi:photosystem II stability/assembly factor-like uncharacterized protein